ncbi:hypothetical protein BDV96DRAFT_337631 [Lophiotrema nucula]|uniref:Peroxisomal biogenesis factor 11 n=1 Tax=Lophiotrema nucula TaxID=690887 RepID=A0A6A5YGK1_9PLEO|nr:hypothetical protein BDV96DRAFT_337631 [Lophiotrema nucula]
MPTDAHPPVNTTTTIPSNPTLTPPSPTSPHAAPEPPPPSTPLQAKLRIIFLRALYKLAHSTDRTLLRLSNLLSTPAGTDSLLCTLAYTLELLRALGSQILERRLTNLAATIAEKADPLLLPGETLIASFPASTGTRILGHFVGGSKSLAAVISEFRIFVRLWGLVGIYTWARATYNSPLPAGAGRKEKVLRVVAWSQILSCAAFQILENGAYLASKGVLTSQNWSGEVGKRRETRWWVWSSRFWALHVALEGVRLWTLHRYRRSAGETVEERDGEKEGKLLVEESRKEDGMWRRDVVSNSAYFPMTLHWSTETGFLSDAGVGALGAVAGAALLLDNWRNAA